MNDYSAYDTGAGHNLFAQITATAEKQRDLETRIADLEAELKQVKAEHREVSEVTLPELMGEARQTTITTDSGLTVTVEDKVHASIPAKNLGEAVPWLRDNGGAAIVKNQVAIQYGLGEDDKARETAERLAKEGEHVKQNYNVPWASLTSWLNERLSTDPKFDPPAELLGMYRKRQAKVK